MKNILEQKYFEKNLRKKSGNFGAAADCAGRVGLGSLGKLHVWSGVAGRGRAWLAWLAWLAWPGRAGPGWRGRAGWQAWVAGLARGLAGVAGLAGGGGLGGKPGWQAWQGGWQDSAAPLCPPRAQTAPSIFSGAARLRLEWMSPTRRNTFFRYAAVLFGKSWGVAKVAKVANVFR